MYHIESLFHIGNFQGCITEGSRTRLDHKEDLVYRDFLVMRSYIHLDNEAVVLDEFRDDEVLPPALAAVVFFAKYSLATKRFDADEVNEILEEASQVAETDEYFDLVMAIIYMREKNLDKAWQFVRNSTLLEARALIVQIFLGLNRLDLAQKEIHNMQGMDDNAVIVRLSTAWTSMYRYEEDAVESALMCFQDLMTKYGSTISLLNNSALAYMQSGNYEAAEESLLQALEKDPRSSETKINLSVLYSNTNQEKRADSQFKQLRANDPENMWVKAMTKVERDFDRSSSRF
eukprot:TRINITY_DN1934_c0_g1_i1.p1 TRINITY_DN1934_c0_g1~~TRINITY_DN1934_c0_g1_i1.p1  ORF type:complete len:301 (+),score=83.93 TRINITY_DN1934_c0_g1_i1:39-905(+)